MFAKETENKILQRRPKLRGAIIAEGYHSMSEAANLAGLAPSTIYAYVSGWKVPGRHGIKRLAKLLNISTREVRELL